MAEHYCGGHWLPAGTAKDGTTFVKCSKCGKTVEL